MTLKEKVIEFLKNHPNTPFTPRDIAQALAQIHAEEYQLKRQKYADSAQFVRQLSSEISARVPQIHDQCPNIQTSTQPKTLRFVPTPCEENKESNQSLSTSKHSESSKHSNACDPENSRSEIELYPKLMQFLSAKLKLHCCRINEKTSKNSRGPRGNKWLHPDVVAMQVPDKTLPENVRKCMESIHGKYVFLWSFEIKTRLDGTNVRENFFQAVSNSSWANEGYLVTTAIEGKHTEEELRTLSALHGIGVLLLDAANVENSHILLPAKRKEHADWQSIARIVEQNGDFKTYISQVSNYYQTGSIHGKYWYPENHESNKD